MRRSRVRLGWCALAGVMALAWPAALVGTAVPAVADPTSLTVSPATVQAGQDTMLVFTFTAPTPPPAQFLTVTLPVPAGWTAIPPSPAARATAPSTSRRCRSSRAGSNSSSCGPISDNNFASASIA